MRTFTGKGYEERAEDFDYFLMSKGKKENSDLCLGMFVHFVKIKEVYTNYTKVIRSHQGRIQTINLQNLVRGQMLLTQGSRERGRVQRILLLFEEEV